MKYGPMIFLVTSLLVVAAFCSSIPYSTFLVLAEPSGQIECKRTGTIAVTCCQEHIINRGPANPAGTLVKYCTDCAYIVDGAGDWHIQDCGSRYIAMAAEEPVTPPPDAVSRLQGILGKVTTLPEVSVLEGQRANVTILPGGILQSENNLTFSQANISSGNTSSDILSLGQSDLVSDEEENNTSSSGDEDTGPGEKEEKEESGTTDEGASKQGDEPEDEDSDVDKELPTED